MALRNVAGGAARMSAGFWTEVAKAISPPAHTHAGSQEPASPATSDTGHDAPDVAPPERSAAPAAEPAAGTDGVLVPLDTWTRVLDQLGNLHEAGRELAEARERAARAETQVEFLREQLAEAKPKPKRKPAAPNPPEPAASHDPAPDATQVIDLRSGRRLRVTNARNRVGRWISTS